MKLPKDARPRYVCITETKCAKCIHFEKIINLSLLGKEQKREVVAYRCEPNGQFWYPTDKLYEFFAENCIHFKPKPSEAQK